MVFEADEDVRIVAMNLTAPGIRLIAGDDVIVLALRR